jgi:hypothetical protein
MNSIARAAVIGAVIVLLLSTCKVFSGFEPYEERNVNGFRSLNLGAAEMNRLSFGTSSREAGGTLAAPSGCVIQDTADNASYTGERKITITATNTRANAGKIAGSEDGIAYYFKEVDKSKNFRLTADFYIEQFGFARSSDLNGQEGFGIMARDYVPQYISNTTKTNETPISYDLTMEGIRTGINTETGGPSNTGRGSENFNPETDNLAMSMYYTGKNRADGPGGSGNMIMVGGVKRGARVYWRTGVTDPVGDAVTNPDTVADASRAKFSFQPREFADYSPWGTGREGVESRPDFPKAGLTYTFSLEKTNSGFRAAITPDIYRLTAAPADASPDSPEIKKQRGITKNRELSPFAKLEYNDKELPFPDLLFSVNSEKYYVGFFACRDAKVTITNIRYEESEVEDCPPRNDPAPIAVTPSFEVVSPGAVSSADYILYARSNVEGSVSVKINGGASRVYAGDWKTEPSNASAEPFSFFAIPVDNLKTGDNVFDLAFTPDSNQAKSGYLTGTEYLMTSTRSLYQSFVVRRGGMNGEDGILWVSPEGRSGNAGTRASPLDIATAIALVAPGQTITLMDGIYTPLEPQVLVNGVMRNPARALIPRYNNGRPDSYKKIIAEHRDRAIFDFRKDIAEEQKYDVKGFELQGDYWWIEGIHVRNTVDGVKGLTVMGSNNVVRWVKTYFNGDTGLQISGRSTEPKSMWPSNNRIEYCESFANMDDSREDADGFASKLTSGPGNVFSYCIAHHNADDGWDLFAKKETGAIGALRLENCIAYSNGKFLNAELSRKFSEGKQSFDTGMDGTSNSGGNGFKMGGEGISVLHEAVNCLSFYNDTDGFTSNSDPAILLTQVTSFDNGWTVDLSAANRPGNFAVYGAGSAGYTNLDAVMTQIVSLYTSGPSNPDRVELKTTASGYKWDGSKTTNIAYLKAPDESYKLLPYRSLTVADNVESTVIPYHVSGGRNVAPFDPTIEGRFLEYEQKGDGWGYKLNNFLKLKNVAGVVPGAQGLWD